MIFVISIKTTNPETGKPFTVNLNPRHIVGWEVYEDEIKIILSNHSPMYFSMRDVENLESLDKSLATAIMGLSK